MDPPPFLLWPGFRGSIRERVSLRDKGARARGVGEVLGLCAGFGAPAATPRRPPAPGFHVCLSPRTARGSAGYIQSSQTDADCLSRMALPTGSLGGL